MPKCKKCGKKGLFLQLFLDGLCYTCAKNRVEEVKKKKDEAIRLAEQEKEKTVRAEKEAIQRKIDERIEEKKNEFDKILNNLLPVRCDPDDKKYPKLPVHDLSNLRFTNVTRKSRIDKLKSYIVIDVETTGLSAQKNEIIEVSAIKFEEFEPTEIFSTLIRPQKEIPLEATIINGITNEMVALSPRFEQIITCLSEFIHGYNLVGHNLDFDLKFLYKNGLNVLCEKRKFYDTLQLARSLLKKPKEKWDKNLQCYISDYEEDYHVENHKLETLCTYYDIVRNTAHRSSTDCLATGVLFQKLVDERMRGLLLEESTQAFQAKL